MEGEPRADVTPLLLIILKYRVAFGADDRGRYDREQYYEKS